MSIVGLVIALGLLVDNAIVVTESIGQKLKLGLHPLQAAAEGTSQVAWAIASGTVTTILAFVPMLMMQSNTGSFMRSMPVTVVLVLTASFFIAVTLAPLMASRIFKQRGAGEAGSGRNFVQRQLERLSCDHYQSVLGSALKHPVLGYSDLAGLVCRQSGAVSESGCQPVSEGGETPVVAEHLNCLKAVVFMQRRNSLPKYDKQVRDVSPGQGCGEQYR